MRVDVSNTNKLASALTWQKAKRVPLWYGLATPCNAFRLSIRKAGRRPGSVVPNGLSFKRKSCSNGRLHRERYLGSEISVDLYACHSASDKEAQGPDSAFKAASQKETSPKDKIF